MLQCDVVALEVEDASGAHGPTGAPPQQAPGTASQWNMIRLNRRPIVLRGLRHVGAEELYRDFRPHVAGNVSFMPQQAAMELQAVGRQQVPH